MVNSQETMHSTEITKEIEKYKQEVLEGLQIEEEGLTEYFRKKIKQDQPIINSVNYNEPVQTTFFTTNRKASQILKTPPHIDMKNTNETQTKNNNSSTKSIVKNENRLDTSLSTVRNTVTKISMKLYK